MEASGDRAPVSSPNCQMDGSCLVMAAYTGERPPLVVLEPSQVLSVIEALGDRAQGVSAGASAALLALPVWTQPMLRALALVGDDA